LLAYGRPSSLGKTANGYTRAVHAARLAPQARLRLIPNLTDANLNGLGWHFCGLTALAIAQGASVPLAIGCGVGVRSFCTKGLTIAFRSPNHA
jgi:hypothetical protein